MLPARADQLQLVEGGAAEPPAKLPQLRQGEFLGNSPEGLLADFQGGLQGILVGDPGQDKALSLHQGHRGEGGGAPRTLLEILGAREAAELTAELA